MCLLWVIVDAGKSVIIVVLTVNKVFIKIRANPQKINVLIFSGIITFEVKLVAGTVHLWLMNPCCFLGIKLN